MKNIFRLSLLGMLVILIGGSCQKTSRPPLGDYPVDANPPGGPLKFYTAFDGTTDNPLMNAVDSIRANFPSANPLTSIPGVSGQAVQGASGVAINYPSANDFKTATSFTLAFWVKRSVNTNTEFYFSLKDDTYGWSHSAIFLLVEHGTDTAASFKVGLMDQWMEFPDSHQFHEPLLDGNWHHLAIVYDETTSQMAYYFDGEQVTDVPASALNVTKNGQPRGPLDLTKATNFVIGGWNKHAGLSGPTDDWVSSFGGAMDQFRVYGKVLTPTEIKDLFTNKQ
ncbi:LamG domain-containing protein [Flavihumibacter profundi]|jgi:hypothetical protein|uniref:LamG domain-containing protein n=1 Tax=Flavihumibacter profundi TaxID=2716883 RepID=UPI001CC73AC9|nr:LamG domain-containing protein [Flavihumibacter profundi]MBZ5857806.1 LamG domain-containing protein [Flavihumibacter profundi]